MGVYTDVMEADSGLGPVGVESELKPAPVLPTDGGAFLPELDETTFAQNFAGAEITPELPPAPNNPRTADRSTDVGGPAGKAVRLAQSLVGIPYDWGGSTTAGFDCSGLVQYVYKKAYGIDLPRISADQARFGKRVGIGNLSAGDLVAWDLNNRNNGADHIAIYIGSGLIVEAPRPGVPVRIRKLGNNEGAWGVRIQR